MEKILIVDEICDSALKILESNNRYQIGIISNEDFRPSMLTEIDGLIVKERTEVNPEFLDQAKNLKVIVVGSGGYDNIDLNATNNLKIPVMYCPKASSGSAAELTMMFALMLSRNFSASQQALSHEDWTRTSFIGHDLFMKSIGLIGLGEVGSRVAEMARGFKMVVAAYDPYLKDEVFEKLDVVRANSLEELLRISNIVSLHLPATKQNRDMVNANFFEMMQDESMLINTSRGYLLNEEDLIVALESGKLAGAALDVFKEEPLHAESPLFSAPNLIMTPHIGSVTSNTYRKVGHQAVSRLMNFFEKGEIIDQADLQ